MPEQAIASKTIPAGTLVTAPSFLIDRFKPDCEIIALPEKVMMRGTLSWNVGPITAKPPKKESGFRALIGNGNGYSVETAPEGCWIIDLRHNSPANWAHFLNNHLPALFAVADAAGLDPKQALAILPSDIPGYILNVAGLFGINTRLTDNAVEGHGVTYELDSWGALRTARAGWLRLPAPQARLSAIMAEPSETPLPKKVFLIRKDTRTLSNEREIEELLAQRGFESVLPESLSPADQFRLFLGAEEIVAIHGAGLAPLLFCMSGARPRRFIELLPCGHMTDVYRVVAAEVGVPWIGVRGRIKPEYISHVYNMKKRPYVTHSLDHFEVDPDSLERAFGLAERPNSSVAS